MSQRKTIGKEIFFLSGADGCKHKETVEGVSMCPVVSDPAWKLRTDYAFES